MNTFEDKLLTELRTVVAERPVDIRRKRPKRVLIGIAACLTLAAGTAVAVPMLGGEQATSPAYAVNTGPDGKVSVRIYRYEDAEGLEKRIRAAGVAAEVTLVPDGKSCRRTPAPKGQFDAKALSFAAVNFDTSLVLDPARFRGMTLLIDLIAPSKHSPGGVSLPVRAKTGSFGPCVVVNN